MEVSSFDDVPSRYPGTIVIFTQMSGLAWLNVSTIAAITSEVGGVCSVQNLTSVAPA